MTDSVFRYQADGEPRTHVLIVGVGHYPAFRGGGATANPDAPLGQLISPPRSARALADWFIGQYRYPPAPLGSLTLLIAQPQAETITWPDQGAIEVGQATYDQFETAAQAWSAKGDHPDSRLVFIFCGHGYGYGGETSLLLSDFDFRKPNLWDRALDLGAFIAGLEQTPACEQIFFVDACRAPHPAQINPNTPTGRSPVQVASAKPREGLPRRNAPLFFSTGQAQPAHGQVGGVSVFTTAFLDAMAGMAARDDEGDWRVNNYALLDALDHVSKRLTAEAFESPQQPQGAEARRFEFHHLPGDPISPVYVVRDDGAPCGPATLRYGQDGEPKLQACTEDDVELALALPYGHYEFELVGPGGEVLAAAAGRSEPTYKKARLLP